jgi:hypothetical protein
MTTCTLHFSMTFLQLHCSYRRQMVGRLCVMIREGSGRKLSCSVLRYCGTLLEELRKNTKSLAQDMSLDWDCNSGPLDNEAGVPTCWPSMLLLWTLHFTPDDFFSPAVKESWPIAKYRTECECFQIKWSYYRQLNMRTKRLRYVQNFSFTVFILN